MFDFLTSIVFVGTLAVFYRMGYRKGIVDGLDRILDDLEND